MGCRISTPTQVERMSMDSSTENLIEQYENTVRQSSYSYIQQVISTKDIL